MKRHLLLPWFLAIALVGAGCAPVPVSPKGAKKRPPASDSSETRSQLEPASAFTGKVLGLDGLPAANVTVRGHLISNNGGGLVSDRGGAFRVLATGLETKTDAEGRFKLAHPEGKPLNLEAVESDEVKAIRFQVPADAADVQLQLAPTGTISGKVSAPKAPSVTNFQGVSVFVPGTSYGARTDAEGRYTITNMPVGAFTLVAEKTGLGEAVIEKVEVNSRATTEAPELALSVQAPVIASVTPANAAPGTELTIKGERFGASTGAPLEVRVGGVDGVSVERIDDTTIKLKVPESGSSDGIVVKVNQIASAPAAFQVIKELALKPAMRYMVVGNSRQYTAVAKDSAGKPVTGPIVKWSVAEGQAITVTDGLVTAQSAGSAKLQLSAGSIVKHQPILVVASADQLPPNEELTWTTQLAATANGIYAAASDRVLRVSLDGTTSVVAGAEASVPGADVYLEAADGVAANAEGTLYVSDRGRIYRLGSDGVMVPFVGGEAAGAAVDGTGAAAGFIAIERLAIDGAGNLYAFDVGTVTARIRKITPAGVVTTLPADVTAMSRFCVASDGTIYVADGSQIYRVSGSELVPLAGGAAYGDGVGEAAGFGDLQSMAVGPDGLLYVADCDQEAASLEGQIRVVDPADGSVVTLSDLGVTFGDWFGGLAFNPDGQLIVIDSAKGKIHALTLP